MLTRQLLRDVQAVVERSFHAREYFSCLTGSILDDHNSKVTSDIDIVVVLPDDIAVLDAFRSRIAFTRHYVELNLTHRRAPDLDWPGEVLYLRDLHAALEGATFAPTTGYQQPPPLCSLDLPYRYWISMIATGTPITEGPKFEHYANRCARLIAWHWTTSVRSTPDDPRAGERYWASQWKLPPPDPHFRARRIAHQIASTDSSTNTTSLGQRGTANRPILERYSRLWSSIARNHTWPPKAGATPKDHQ